MDHNDNLDRSFGQLDEQLQEILTGYVLGSLEPDEMLGMEEYLEAHPELSAIVNRLEESIAAMAYAAPPMAPPSSVKEVLLTRCS